MTKPNHFHGYLKCRLVHRRGLSFIQPDIFFGTRTSNEFFIPQYFSINLISFMDNDECECCIFIDLQDRTRLDVRFTSRSHLVTYKDGSMIYKCVFSPTQKDNRPKPSGKWKYRAPNQYLLRLYHHTNEIGHRGITNSQQIWSCPRNIQGNLWIKNIAYGYFTDLSRIQNSFDLSLVAMSSSGVTGLLPINAPNDPHYATFIPVPEQQAIERSFSMPFWISSDLIAPNNLWLKKPSGELPYYETVFPNILRVGVRPSTNLQINNREIHVPEKNIKQLKYIIVGDGDSGDGLVSAVREETSSEKAFIECSFRDTDMLKFWKRNANTNPYDPKHPELAIFTSQET